MYPIWAQLTVRKKKTVKNSQTQYPTPNAQVWRCKCEFSSSYDVWTDLYLGSDGQSCILSGYMNKTAVS